MKTQSLNKNLTDAKKNKNDEFYTQLSDIEKELKYYKDHFKDKVVYCNCDDPRVSNFFYYFSYNFKHLGLKKLITTCYKSQNPNIFSQHDCEKAIYLEYDGFRDGDVVPQPEDIGIFNLESDGDFRSEECIELLKQTDIVVTNPPFSLFREYVAQLVEYDKKFLILGNMNAITYKEIFPLIKENKLWLGCMSGAREYLKKDGTIQNMGNTCWFTNLEHNRRNAELQLYNNYKNPRNGVEYLKYDNYDAIEVNKTKEIPMDYDGVMGVPISFLDKFNPNQFEIVGLSNQPSLEIDEHKRGTKFEPYIKGEKTYVRTFIKHKNLIKKL